MDNRTSEQESFDYTKFVLGIAASCLRNDLYSGMACFDTSCPDRDKAEKAWMKLVERLEREAARRGYMQSERSGSDRYGEDI